MTYAYVTLNWLFRSHHLRKVMGALYDATEKDYRAWPWCTNFWPREFAFFPPALQAWHPRFHPAALRVAHPWLYLHSWVSRSTLAPDWRFAHLRRSTVDICLQQNSCWRPAADSDAPKFDRITKFTKALQHYENQTRIAHKHTHHNTTVTHVAHSHR